MFLKDLIKSVEKYLFSNWILKDDYPSEKTIKKLIEIKNPTTLTWIVQVDNILHELGLPVFNNDY